MRHVTLKFIMAFALSLFLLCNTSGAFAYAHGGYGHGGYGHCHGYHNFGYGGFGYHHNFYHNFGFWPGYYHHYWPRPYMGFFPGFYPHVGFGLFSLLNPFYRGYGWGYNPYFNGFRPYGFYY